MSALGQKRTSEKARLMSALPPKADMDQHGRDVRFVPKADICGAAKRPPITSSARASSDGGISRPNASAVKGSLYRLETLKQPKPSARVWRAQAARLARKCPSAFFP